MQVEHQVVYPQTGQLEVVHKLFQLEVQAGNIPAVHLQHILENFHNPAYNKESSKHSYYRSLGHLRKKK
uniref:DNA-directed RNA polymerase n=1 Tax=Rhizophora mucronata TaxID=61149 RepID=A0A2P2MP66_RHIMU